MNRPATILALVLTLFASGADATTIEDRIEQGVEAAEGELTVEPLGLPQSENNDASLDPTVKPGHFRTTLEPPDIEQRIDKGLTAAGEASTIPPDFAYGAFQRGWFLTAFSMALDRAKAGDAVAQTLLGVLLSRGLGVKQDMKAAADWYAIAGNSGDREALYALGQLYAEGQGVDRDQAKAAEYFRQAADKGHPGAARELGYLLLEGKGEEQNAMLAAAYLRRSASLGDMDAQYTLAGLFVEGVGVVADEKIAARWFAEAARNGHVGAQVEYAIILFNGRGVPKDEVAAAAWFSRAAHADNPVAQLRLARLFSEGLGVENNPAEAARWYLIAKEHGLDDETMESFLERLNASTRSEAEAAADAWLRRGQLRTALAPPPETGPPVDNPVE